MIHVEMAMETDRTSGVPISSLGDGTGRNPVRDTNSGGYNLKPYAHLLRKSTDQYRPELIPKESCTHKILPPKGLRSLLSLLSAPPRVSA